MREATERWHSKEMEKAYYIFYDILELLNQLSPEPTLSANIPQKISYFLIVETNVNHGSRFLLVKIILRHYLSNSILSQSSYRLLALAMLAFSFLSLKLILHQDLTLIVPLPVPSDLPRAGSFLSLESLLKYYFFKGICPDHAMWSGVFYPTSNCLYAIIPFYFFSEHVHHPNLYHSFRTCTYCFVHCWSPPTPFLSTM